MTVSEGKGREGKGREGKGRKGREGKGREGKGREGKGREGREGSSTLPVLFQSLMAALALNFSGLRFGAQGFAFKSFYNPPSPPLAAQAPKLKLKALRPKS